LEFIFIKFGWRLFGFLGVHATDAYIAGVQT